MGKYQLGAALLHMGSSYLDGNELRTRALNWSDSLASRSHESVRIGTLHEGRVLIVHHVFRPDDSLQVLDVGTLLPAHATALGKALLADSPYIADELAAAGLDRFTPATVTDPGASCARSSRRPASAGGQRRSKSSSQVRSPTPRRSRTAGACSSARSASPGPSSASKGGEPSVEPISYVREAARAVSRDLGAIPGESAQHEP